MKRNDPTCRFLGYHHGVTNRWSQKWGGVVNNVPSQTITNMRISPCVFAIKNQGETFIWMNREAYILTLITNMGEDRMVRSSAKPFTIIYYVPGWTCIPLWHGRKRRFRRQIPLCWSPLNRWIASLTHKGHQNDASMTFPASSIDSTLARYQPGFSSELSSFQSA